jgi:hypothetical protein
MRNLEKTNNNKKRCFIKEDITKKQNEIFLQAVLNIL